MQGSLYEVRDYHYDPARIDEYRDWAEEAAAVLGELMDLVGWWVEDGIPPRIHGEDPMELRHGLANVTWIIRWDDIDHREEVWTAMWDEPTWQACWDRHPGPDGYRQMTSRFMHRV